MWVWVGVCVYTSVMLIHHHPLIFIGLLDICHEYGEMMVAVWCVYVCLWVISNSWASYFTYLCDVCAAANRLSGRDSSHGFAKETGIRRVPSDNQVQGSDEPVREQDYPSVREQDYPCANKSHVSYQQRHMFCVCMLSVCVCVCCVLCVVC